jgi:predicted transcriptional regulator of viral defense system
MLVSEIDLINILPSIRNVITVGELRTLFPKVGNDALMKFLKRLILKGTLLKVKAGLYATKNASLIDISYKLNSETYLSFDSVLSKYGIMGSVPSRHVAWIKVGSPKMFKCDLGLISHYSINSKYFFGYRTVEGIQEATPEKAFIDICYFLSKGKHFSFNITSEIYVKDFNTQLIEEYLQNYPKRFVDYTKKLIEQCNG